MSKDKAEEKAKKALLKIKNEYAVNSGYEDWIDYLDTGVSNSYYCPDQVVTCVANAYADSLSTENAQLREALREAFNLICDSTEYEVGINRYKDGVLKIKQLLTDKE